MTQMTAWNRYILSQTTTLNSADYDGILELQQGSDFATPAAYYGLRFQEMPVYASLDDIVAIAEQLASGFELLAQQLKEQREVEIGLRQRLEKIAASRSARSSPSRSSSSRSQEWTNRSKSPNENTTLSPAAVDQTIITAQEALRKLQDYKMPTATRVGKCPVAHKVMDQEDFERDFTVPGKPSDLGCPFAKAGSKPSLSVADPIAAEFHGDKSSTRSPDAGSQCPIRFLDQHSPEEIAQYFENHKHEMPRSHQICVKRYQQNEQSIRELDAKYGNIVSMIQGLGTKHKQYLPEDGKVPDASERPSNEAVEKWAEDVSRQSLPGENGDERASRFEKPLRDIRVGESPSRPWGIPVPAEKSPAASAAPSVHDVHPAEATDLKESPRVMHEELRPKETTFPTQPQIVFNGPVFFGYSPEQAATFLQHLNISTPK